MKTTYTCLLFSLVFLFATCANATPPSPPAEALFEQAREYEPGSEENRAYLRKAAEQGHVEAQRTLGFIYAYLFEGNEKDLEQAQYWYCKAAEQGDFGAFCELGTAYLNLKGQGHFDQAMHWYRKAAEQGHAEAKSILLDLVQAETVYRKAIEQNDAKAQLILGTMYLRGKGVKENRDWGLAWIRQAAEQGNEQAKALLLKLGEHL